MADRVTTKPGIGRALIAELLGTFVLVFVVILVVSMYALQADVARGLTYPFIAFAHGFVLLLLIQTVGSISGGHFNPAVTLGLLSIRQIAPRDALAYIGTQLVGAVGAAVLAWLTIKDQAGTVDYAATKIADSEINLGSAIILELLFTFFLVWAIVGTAVNPDGPREWAPVVIAGTLTLGVLLIAPLTGASLNPARSIGPALIANEWGDIGEFLLAYIAAPIVGGIAAALLYSGLFMRPSGAQFVEPPAPSEQSPL